MLKNLSQLIRFYKYKISMGIKYHRSSSNEIILKDSKNPKIYYFMVPTHGNIGDQAIAQATLNMLVNEYNEYEVVVINDDELANKLRSVEKNINSNDLVFLHGGGNMGDLYPSAEYQRMMILKKLNHNSCVIMTQTAYFSSSIFGEFLSRKSMKVYEQHPNLTILAREQKTYQYLSEKLTHTKVKLLPDIVFGLEVNTKSNRHYIMSLLRSDEESILADPKQLLADLHNRYDQLFIYDNYVTRRVDEISREAELASFLQRMVEAKVVITDRMHGMILAAITKTPCVVTKSLDDKILGSYEWIKDLNYIRLLDNFSIEEISKNVDELLELDKLTDFHLKDDQMKNVRKVIGL